MAIAAPVTHPDYNSPSTWTAAKPPPNMYSIDDVINHLTRMETRLVKLMHHVGLDANGRVRDEN